jgi:hypothetical protein
MQNNKTDSIIDWKNLFRMALVAGIVYLAMNDKDGWGWLTFILFITF